MKKKNRIIAIIMTILLILAIIIGIVAANKQKEIKEANTPNIPENQTSNEKINEENSTENQVTENTASSEETENATEQEKTSEIEDLKNETGSKGDSKIYDVAQEYDGKKTLTVKPSVQFQTVLAGAIKNGKPEETEVTKIVNGFSYKKGAYITKQSREKFIELLKSLGIDEFSINDNDGYIAKISEPKNNLAKQLESLINNGKTYVIDMTGTCYMRDDVTGEIVEYPFEKMDPSEICEPFISGSNTLLAITSNKDNTIAASEIIQTILQY